MWCFYFGDTRLIFFQIFGSSVAFDLVEIREEFDQKYENTGTDEGTSFTSKYFCFSHWATLLKPNQD